MAASEAGKVFDILYFGGAEGGDAVVGEIALIVEGAGIAKIAWQLELGREPDAVAVMKERHGGNGRSGFGDFF